MSICRIRELKKPDVTKKFENFCRACLSDGIAVISRGAVWLAVTAEQGLSISGCALCNWTQVADCLVRQDILGDQVARAVPAVTLKELIH
jgi:hypothetical protein